MTEQAPYDESGKPFPTTYYLTCRHLVAAVSRLEAAGGVERWTAAVRADRRLADSVERANAEQRALRHELARAPAADPDLDSGIGGARGDGSLKCLHAHVAFALARPGYELGERVLAEVEPLWPQSCCTAAD